MTELATTTAAKSVNVVTSRIEDTFARIGQHLGRSHGIFEGLQRDLGAISKGLSGTDIESASTALQKIAQRLTDLADAIPRQSATLRNIDAGSHEISVLLQRLVKGIQMIAVIARSARIEAVSLSDNRGHFQDFTQEVLNLAKAAHALVEACKRDQELLTAAIGGALTKQSEFEKLYRDQLLSVSKDLLAAYGEIRERQIRSVGIANAATAGASKISEAVGHSIVSLQAGDSVRQRLEHVCYALELAANSNGGASLASPSLQPHDPADPAALIAVLQAEQLKDAASGFEADIGRIAGGLKILSTDAAKIITGGRSLYGDQGDGGMTSFLGAMKQGLAQASSLISRCTSARTSVGDATLVFENTLAKFRNTISDLTVSVDDIILVGMNASLKAAHLGTQGQALVVIANELGATAADISNNTEMLKPVLGTIGKSAADLKALQLDEDALNVTDLKQSIAQVVQNVETSNGQLFKLMERLSTEGTQFERLVEDAQSLLSNFSRELQGLKQTAAQLASAASGMNQAALADDPGFRSLLQDKLYPKYTMAGEREIHVSLLRRWGIDTPTAAPTATTNDASADEVLFF